MIRFDIVRTVFFKELREMLRDRRSLAVMFGLPLVLYPLLAIGIAVLGKARKQELADTPARVALANGEDAPEFLRRLNTRAAGSSRSKPGTPTARCSAATSTPS